MNEMVRNVIISVVACVLIVVYSAFGIPYSQYRKAVSLQEAGKYVEAYDAFLAMDGYKDSAQRAKDIFEEYKAEKFKNPVVGSTLYFGKYEQDNDLTNGPEDIEWVILDIVDGKALVISQCGLDAQPYHDTFQPVTWQDCSLRSWLNSEFWNTAFSREEQAKILTTTVADARDETLTTEDKVYLLSYAELEYYMDDPDSRRRDATAYASARGGYINSYSGTCWWWSRTPTGSGDLTATVDAYGYLENFGSRVTDTSVSVAPSIWIQLDK